MLFFSGVTDDCLKVAALVLVATAICVCALGLGVLISSGDKFPLALRVVIELALSEDMFSGLVVDDNADLTGLAVFTGLCRCSCISIMFGDAIIVRIPGIPLPVKDASGKYVGCGIVTEEPFGVVLCTTAVMERVRPIGLAVFDVAVIVAGIFVPMDKTLKVIFAVATDEPEPELHDDPACGVVGGVSKAGAVKLDQRCVMRKCVEILTHRR